MVCLCVWHVWCVCGMCGVVSIYIYICIVFVRGASSVPYTGGSQSVDEPLREVAPLAKPYLRDTSGVKKTEKRERKRERERERNV